MLPTTNPVPAQPTITDRAHRDLLLIGIDIFDLEESILTAYGESYLDVFSKLRDLRKRREAMRAAWFAGRAILASGKKVAA